MFLLSVNFSYSQADIDLQSLVNNEALTYRSYAKEKALGLDFSLKYPKSWANKEGNRDNIIQKFVKQIDGCQVAYLVLLMKIEDLRLMSETEIREEFKNLPKTVPNSTTVLSINTNLKIDGQPSCELISKDIRKADENVMNVDIAMYNLNYFIIFKDYYIQLQCAVTGPLKSPKTEQFFNDYKPFFKQVANSFIIHSKWK